MIHTFSICGYQGTWRDKDVLRKALSDICAIQNGVRGKEKVKFKIGRVFISTKAKTEATIDVDTLRFGLCYWDIKTVKWDDVEKLLIFNDSLAIKV